MPRWKKKEKEKENDNDVIGINAINAINADKTANAFSYRISISRIYCSLDNYQSKLNQNLSRRRRIN